MAIIKYVVFIIALVVVNTGYALFWNSKRNSFKYWAGAILGPFLVGGLAMAAMESIF